MRPTRLTGRVVWLAVALAAGLAIVVLPLPAAGLLVVGVAILLAILIEPLVGLTLTLLLGPWGALENIILGGSSFDTGQLLLLLTLAAWLARSVVRREIRLPALDKGVALAFVLFITFGALSLLQEPPSPLSGLKELAKWLQIGLVAWFAASETGRPHRVRWVAAAALLAGLSQALIGIWQFGLRGHGPEHFEIVVNVRGYLLDAFRAYGTFEQPNPFAGFLGLSLPLALGWGIGKLAEKLAEWAGGPRAIALRQGFGRAFVPSVSTELDKVSGRGAQPSPQGDSSSQFGATRVTGTAGSRCGTRTGRYTTIGQVGGFALPWLLAGTLGVALLASWSRGGWLGAAAGVTAMLYFLPRRRWLGALLVLVLLLAGWGALESGLVPESIAGRLTGFADYVQFQDARGVDITPANYAVLERMAHWQAALNMANAHPWLGVGLGNYEAAYADYALINWPYALGHAHNYYLNILAETGILGLVAYLGFWAAVIALTARVIRHAPYPQRGLALGLMGAWVHLSVHHLVDKLYVNNIYLHLGALLGILICLQNQHLYHHGKDTG